MSNLNKYEKLLYKHNRLKRHCGNQMNKIVEYKSRIEKAVEYIENNEVCCLEYIGRNEITGNLEKKYKEI